MKPPFTPVADTAETIHGVSVADPYRWLEDEGSPEVQAWVDAQNAHTRSVLDPLPGRGPIRRRLELLLSIGSIGTPSVRRGRTFHTRRDGTANQPVLYVRDAVGGRDRVLLDPNPLSSDGTIALDWYYPSWDGRYVAYGLSKGGSEQSVLHVRDVGTGADLPDAIPHARACSLAWEPSGTGFFYTRYPAPGSVPPGEENYNRRVFHHTLGEDPSIDPLVFGEGRKPDAWANVAISENGRWLVVIEAEGWILTRIYLRDLSGPGGFVPVIEGREALYGAIPLDDRLIIHTNEDASTYRVYVADPRDPSRPSWKEIIPPAADVLQTIDAIGGRIVAQYLVDASSRLRIFSLDGTPEGSIDLPALGSVTGLSGEWQASDVFFGFMSFAIPPTIHRYDLASGRLDLWDKVEAPIDPGGFTIEQVRCVSRDGTSIPIFLVHGRAFRRDGGGAVMLNGYGGFNISLTPAFERDNFVWLERGGAIAVANLRGGGEYGEAWHRAGMLDRKQNVFDDFIAAAEYLIREKYTSPGRLVIQGGSNGGLLVGAALTQRPDLFRAVVCSVPLLDMLRYHRFQIARLWIPEYGSADDAEAFAYLRAYSPYHRVEDGAAYPAVLLTTGESDSRVDPMHARKMAARLQAAQNDRGRPILLRLETRAGHGAGKPLAKQIDEQTDIWSFLIWQAGLDLETGS